MAALPPLSNASCPVVLVASSVCIEDTRCSPLPRSHILLFHASFVNLRSPPTRFPFLVPPLCLVCQPPFALPVAHFFFTVAISIFSISIRHLYLCPSLLCFATYPILSISYLPNPTPLPSTFFVGGRHPCLFLSTSQFALCCP